MAIWRSESERAVEIKAANQSEPWFVVAIHLFIILAVVKG